MANSYNAFMKLEQILSESFEAFFAVEDRLADLKKQLKCKLYTQGSLVLAAKGENQSAYFAENHWPSPRVLRFESEHELKTQLESFRRPTFFQASGTRSRFKVSARALPQFHFPEKIAVNRWLEWTILDSHYALVCEREGRFPLNQVEFNEDKRAPSRAYLKLWEIFLRTGQWPKENALCIELGSAPGGWTYVLDQLKARVISVDRAELEEVVMASGRVQHQIRDAFALKPDEVPPVDWFFSDLICFPDKLLELVRMWKQSGKVKNFVCTLKFKGATDWKSIAEFERLGGKLVHLNHNKHELTWYLLEKNQND